jgi:hypothetical protein
MTHASWTSKRPTRDEWDDDDDATDYDDDAKTMKGMRMKGMRMKGMRMMTA